jgi:hypothetical protein
MAVFQKSGVFVGCVHGVASFVCGLNDTAIIRHELL